MGKTQGSKLLSSSKRIKQEAGNLIDQVSLKSKQKSPEVCKRLGKQKAGGDGVSVKVDSRKQGKNADHSQMQVIASILTRRRSSQHADASSVVNTQKPEWSKPGKSVNQTAKKLAGKVVKRTLNVSKPSQAGKLPTATVTKSQAKSSIPDLGRNAMKVSQVNANSRTGNHVARLLRSRTPKTSEIFTKMQTDNPEAEIEKKKRRRRKLKKALNEPHQDDTSRIKKRVKYLLNRLKLEQNLIDAYSAEGWKGQSREKIRPERELQRAEAQILQFQLGIREAVQQLDCLGLEGSIEDSVFDSEGQIYHEDIFCAKCKLQEASVNNDIILCDGVCNRAFHQLCLEPPLRTEDIPPGDEGWLCPVCECKAECLDVVNAYLGTNYRVEDHWKKIFAEAAAAASGDGKLVGAVEEWPSEDSEDDDYNPDGDDHRTDQQAQGQEGSANSKDSSGQSSSGKDSTSDSSDDDSEVSFFDEFAGHTESGHKKGSRCEGRNGMDESLLEDEGDILLVGGKRQRKEVDYKKLHDEMFGKNGSGDEFSEDEEWGPRKRLRKAKQSDGASQRDTNESKAHQEKPESVPGSSNTLQTKQSRVRLPSNAVEKLRAVFRENPLPSKACKEGLSRQLGLSFRKVNFWFKNVRYAALKKGLVQSTHTRAKPSGGPHSAAGAVPCLQGSGFPSGMVNGVEESDAFTGLLVEMEMLCQAQLKVENLKRILQEGGPKTITDDLVMYLAVAELREKAQS